MEMQEMGIKSISKTMTKESKQTKTKTSISVVALKGAILNGSNVIKELFQFFFFQSKRRLRLFRTIHKYLFLLQLVSDFTRLSIEVKEYARFQDNYFSNDTVSL